MALCAWMSLSHHIFCGDDLPAVIMQVGDNNVIWLPPHTLSLLLPALMNWRKTELGDTSRPGNRSNNVQMGNILPRKKGSAYSVFKFLLDLYSAVE